MNNAGQLAFWASLSGTGVTTNNDTGLYFYNGATLNKVVRENDPVPEGVGNFNVLSDVPSLNQTGLVAFESSLRNTPFDTNAGTYLYNGGTLVKLARRGDGVPDGGGLFSQSLNTTVNSVGHVRMKVRHVEHQRRVERRSRHLHPQWRVTRETRPRERGRSRGKWEIRRLLSISSRATTMPTRLRFTRCCETPTAGSTTTKASTYTTAARW